MIGMGTVINTFSILVGGLLGRFIGKLFTHEQQTALAQVCGISVIFIAVAGAMEGMLKIKNGTLVGGQSNQK